MLRQKEIEAYVTQRVAAIDRLIFRFESAIQQGLVDHQEKELKLKIIKLQAGRGELEALAARCWFHVEQLRPLKFVK